MSYLEYQCLTRGQKSIDVHLVQSICRSQSEWSCGDLVGRRTSVRTKWSGQRPREHQHPRPGCYPCQSWGHCDGLSVVESEDGSSFGFCSRLLRSRRGFSLKMLTQCYFTPPPRVQKTHLEQTKPLHTSFQIPHNIQMVSLRQRKPQRQYSDIAPGLHDLSDEENPGQGSSSRPPKDDDDISISSGESSEFKPGSPEKQAAKGAAIDDDEEMEDDEPLRSIHDTHTSPPKRPIKKARSQSKGKGKAIAPSSVSVTPTVRSSPVPKPSEGNPLSHIPLEYLRLLGQSAKSIVKPPEPAPDAQRQAFETWLKKKKGNSREESILDSPLPFFTRLLKDPQNGSVRPKVEWSPKVESSLTAKQEKKEKRNQLNNIALGVPWDLWRGEGWWPEMYIGPEGGGDGKRTEWLMREDVRLGLENIGRFKKSELVFLAQG